MKRIIPIAICLILIIALTIPAFAEGTTQFTITPSQSTAARGEEITFTVSVSGENSCTSLGLVLSYDTNVFEIVDGSCSVEGAIQAIFDKTKGIAVLFSGETVPSGQIATFTLKVKAEAAFATTAVSGTPAVKKGSETLPSAVTAANVTITCKHDYDNDCDTECSICGQTREANHSWDNGNVTTDPGCTDAGEKTFTCTVCGATKQDPVAATGHAYDNACDTECNNGCGTTREPDHDYSTKWSSDGENHWHQCSVCGDKTDVLPHEPGDPATEWSAQKCRVCDHVLQPALGHTHNYETQWTKDDRGHWHTCKGCEDLKDYADHVYDNSCDTDCNTCGYVRAIQHTIDPNLWFDADGHWRECTVCGEKSRVEPHIPGPEATETSAQVCIDCGYELAPIVGHTHDYGYDWYFDDAGHWQQCSCGGTSVREAHTWNEGTVTRQPTPEMDGEKYFVCTVCDAEKRETIRWQGGQTPTTPTQPSVSDPEPQPKEFPWWVLVVAGGVLVLGFVVFMIVGAILGQKKTGKFSEK